MRDGITRSTARVAMLAVAMLIVAGTAARADIVLGLEGYWKLDQLFDSNLDVVEMTDSHHAEINSSFSSPTSVAGKLDKGFDYEASDTTVVDAGNGLQLNSVNTATFAAWIKPESFRGNTGAISRNGIIGDNLNNVIFMLTDQGRLALTWDAGVDDYHGLQADAGDALEAGAFYHVAATRNGANIDLYINGVKVKSAANQPTGNFAAFGHIQLGRVNGTTGRDFDGVIDDVRV
ncbi:MAG: LamG domain-containing protein, partial [Planctomycetota bacterium]|nr:LamG domain-containing protein [Planctomycetota bacterium]